MASLTVDNFDRGVLRIPDCDDFHYVVSDDGPNGASVCVQVDDGASGVSLDASGGSETGPGGTADEVGVETREGSEECVDEMVRRNSGSHLGMTKWFSDRLGYGFITKIDGCNRGTDLFVHFSSIRPLNNTHRTLRKGEYVSFDVGANNGGMQAVFVTGVLGGPLMCDHADQLDARQPKEACDPPNCRRGRVREPPGCREDFQRRRL